MFQQLGQQISRIGLALLVGLLVLVFTVTNPFSSNSEGCSSSSSPRYAVRVYGQSITTGDFQAALALAALGMSGGRSTKLPDQVAAQYNLRQHILDGFVERALLAQQAEDLGFSVDHEEVWKQLREDGSALLSLASSATDLRLGREVPFPVNDEDGNFSAENTENVIKYGLNRSLGEFGEAQIQEHLAEQMRQVITAGVHVGRQEVWDAYVQERDRAVISYVRFRPSFFGDGLEPSAEETAAFLESHRDTLEVAYESRKQEFTDLEKQIRARHILVRLEEGASEETETEARARAEGILKRVQAGRETFAELARRYSDDMFSARRGGRLEDGTPSGPVGEALAAMEAGDTSEIVQSPRGLHVLHVDRIVEGTIPKDDALLELAADRFREVEGRNRARSAAEAFLAAARGGANFDDALRDAGFGSEVEDEVDPLRGDRAALPDKPSVERSRRVGRGGAPITGVNNARLMESVFEELTLEAPLPQEVLDDGNEFIAYQLVEREQPDQEDFDDFARERIEDGLTESKRQEALIVYVHGLRKRAEDEGAIVVNEAVLQPPKDGTQQF